MTDNQTTVAEEKEAETSNSPAAESNNPSTAEEVEQAPQAEEAKTVAAESPPADEAVAQAKDEPPKESPEPEAKAEETPAEAASTATAEGSDQTPEPVATASEAAPAAVAAAGEGKKPKPVKKRPAIKKSAKGVAPEPAHVQRFRDAKESNELLNGKVIGWNNGGFHVVIEKITAFCPRSEMDTDRIEDPKIYVDQEFEFAVLRIQDRGRRIVVSRAKLMRKDAQKKAKKLRSELIVGSTVTGRVDSIADFGAFVDLGGLRGLVHISEISRQRVEHPSDELTVGQEIEVKIIRMEENGKRISLSIKELLPDPWRDIKEKYPEGELFTGRVEQSSAAGAVIELEPGLTGWLPRSAMSLPQTASVPRAYPTDRQVKVQVGGVDMRRQRLTLSLEGKAIEGSKADLRDFQRKQQETTETSSFNALAAAFAKVRTSD